MNTYSPKLSEVWTSLITAPSFDLARNAMLFKTLRHDRESAAEPVIAALIESTIREGIISCSQRGSNSLTIELPATVLETAVFARLRDWFVSQGLHYTITDFVTESHGATLASLTIIPG